MSTMHETTMATSAEHDTPPEAGPVPRSAAGWLPWPFQLALAGILGATLPFKFGAAEESVRLFETLGAGAAGRIGTATLEAICVVLLLVPRTAVFGGVLGLGLLAGAILGHVFVLGLKWDGDYQLFGMAVTGFVCALLVTWLRRRELPVVGSRF